MSTQRKTELGRDLQRRADECRKLANKRPETRVKFASRGWTDAQRERCAGKADAYQHAAELADAAVAS